MTMEGLEAIRAQFEGSSYEIERELGAGSMGAVYLARHRRLKRPMVVKVLQRFLAGGTKDRFRMEAQVAAKLRHDNIVDVIDCGSLPDSRPYLVMEYLEGSTLDDLLSKTSCLPVAQACTIARDVLGALGAAHDRGIVHRDIKPANVFVCSTGRVKVIDFGVAKLTEVLSDVAPLRAPTAEGVVVGTPKYMAPEQTSGRHIDHRADIYAVGLVLYRMLTGADPFAKYHGDVANLLRARCRELPPPPSRVAPQPVDRRLDEVVMRALAIDPADRYRSAYEMIGALIALTDAYRQLANELGLEDVDWGETRADPPASRARLGETAATRVPGSAPAARETEPFEMPARAGARPTEIWPADEVPAMAGTVASPPARRHARPGSIDWRQPQVRATFLSAALAGFALALGMMLVMNVVGWLG